MKTKFLLIALTILILNVTNTFAQKNIQAAKEPIKENAKVDEGEMKTYVMVFLKKGAKRDHPAEEAKKIQALHMEHLNMMHKEGMLLMAGPFADDHDIKGILIMNAPDADQIKQLVESDPAIKAGRLIAEYHLWYTKSGTINLP